ncbi:MAG: CHASE domain-containing protein [Nitrospirae bacterium]|nr:CHASE domain-containing protein [Nitrospirota bacterium]
MNFKKIFILNIMPIIIFFFIAIIGFIYIDEIDKRILSEHKRDLIEVTASIAYTIERQLNQSLFATYTLASFISQFGKINNFDKLASDILKHSDGISSLQLAKDGIVSEIFPLKGNEKAIGHNLLKDPKRRTEAFYTIQEKKLTLAGPFVLVQGGVGVIGRLPIFVKDSEGNEIFWGFSIVLIKLEDLLKSAKIDKLAEKGYSFQLSRINPDTLKEEIFAGNTDEKMDSPVSFSFDVPNGIWTLTLDMRKDKHIVSATYQAYFFIVLTSGIIGFLIFIVLKRNEQLKTSNEELTERVRREVTIRMQNEQLLVQQSKMAAMGEMISVIAHQWKQPLSAISILIQDFKDAYDFNEINREYVDGFVKNVLEQIVFMSKTIDDFRNFLKPSKNKESFNVKAAIADVLSILSGQLRNINITWKVKCNIHDKVFTRLSDIALCNETLITGYPNEFKHVILNILSNSKDAIMEKRRQKMVDEGQEGLINMEISSRNGKVIVRIDDNGIGIPDNILERIFEPYFTTKEADKGTGIGLYMARTIIEKNMNGTLSAKNTDLGAMFIIEMQS